MSSTELKTFINNAKSSGMSDIKIYLAMMDSPKFSKGIKKGNDQGMSNRDIAAGLGLNIPRAQADIKSDTQAEVQKQAKAAGKTKAWESGLLGASDLGAGVLQGISYAADGASGGINKLLGTNLDTKSYERVTKQRKEISDFHDARREANGQGFDGWRLAGNVAATAPMAALGRGYQGAKILSGTGAKVAVQNATVGAGISGASFAKDADQRMFNTALGAVGGAAGGAIGEKIGQGVVKATQAVKNQASRFSTTQTNEILASIDQKLGEALKDANIGVKLSDLSDDVIKSLRADAKKALQTGKLLDSESVVRKAMLDQSGIKGTRAQISGNAKQWQEEAELAKIQGAGDDLRQKFISDNEQLAKLLDSESLKTGGNAVDKFAVGREASDSLTGQYAQNKQFVRSAYDAANNTPGNDVLISGQGFANDVFTKLDDQALATFLPADIRNIVKQINDNPQFFTLKKGEELIKVLNSHYKSSMQMGEPTATTHALGVVRQSLQSRQDEALQGLLSHGGNDAAQAYQFAREAHKANSALKARIPMLQDVLKQHSKGSINYDDLYKKYILNGKADELAQTFDVLKNTNPQAIADIQQEVIKDISAKAINGNGQFSPAGMKGVLDAIGDRKLGVIFSKEQVKNLKNIRAAGHYATTQPNHAYVNNSNSASGLMNYFGGIIKGLDAFAMRVPYLNKVRDLAVIPVKSASNHRASHTALKGGDIASKIPAPLNQGEQSLIDRLVRAGILSGANLPNQ